MMQYHICFQPLIQKMVSEGFRKDTKNNFSCVSKPNKEDYKNYTNDPNENSMVVTLAANEKFQKRRFNSFKP